LWECRTSITLHLFLLQIYPSLKEEGSVLGGATQRVTKYVPISVLFFSSSNLICAFYDHKSWKTASFIGHRITGFQCRF